MAAEFLLRQKGDTQNPILGRLYGKGSTRGLPVYRKLLSGSGVNAQWVYASLLAQGGRYGCDGMDQVRCNGGIILENPGANPNWVFHPGTRSTGWNDPVQGRSRFFPEFNIAFSGQSWIEGKMTLGVEDPTRMEFFMRGLKVMDYVLNDRGHLEEIGPAFVSSNNALACIDLLREVGKFPFKCIDRWASTWIDFKTKCSQTLAWNKAQPGAAPDIVNVPRYDSHVPFASQVDTMTAFESIMLRAPGVSWQDVNGGIKILTTPNRSPVHTLRYDPTQTTNLSNTVKGSFSGQPMAVEEMPNFFIYQYHDIEDEAYVIRTIFRDRQHLRDLSGGLLNPIGPINLGLMYESLAQRMAASQVRQLVDEPFTKSYNVKGRFDSYHVARCDNVWLAHDVIGVRDPAPILARVTKETFEEKKGERSFITRQTTLDYYKDTDHGPKEGGIF